MMPETYRVAVIGHTGRGNYGHGLDVVWSELPSCKVVAIADPDEKGRQAALARNQVSQGYADYQEMLQRERPDIVAIASRFVDAHFDMIMACVEHGCHMFVEKPFCGTLSQADQIIRACEQKHVHLALAHQTRYSPTLAMVQKLMQDGRIGTILEIRGRGKEDHRGGGEDLWVLGSHVLNMMRTLVGAPQWCFATLTQGGRAVVAADVQPGNEGLGPLAGDAVHATYGLPNGVMGRFDSVRDAGGDKSRFGLQVFGSKGILDVPFGYLESAWLLVDPLWSPGRSNTKWSRVTSAGVDQPEPIKPGGIPGGNRAAVSDLLRAIEGHRAPLCSMYSGRDVLEMIMGVFESHRLKGPVPLPLTNREHPLAL